jgi:hypothetical protein
MVELTLDYEPSERQRVMHGTIATQIFYGGAAGGGKSRAMRAEAFSLCMANPGLESYLFRRTNKELIDNHVRPFMKEIPQILPNGEKLYTYNADNKRIQFTNGSAINFAYCENEHDVTRYQGAEMHALFVDEASHLTEYQLTYLRTRVRLGSWKPSKEYEKFLPKIIFASNPGNVGHSFLKLNFVDAAPRETLFYDESTADPEDNYPGHLSIYIPATMDDNPHLERGYSGQFSALEPELARALREGDWDAVVGKAIHNLSRDKHMTRAFSPPRHWTKFMVMDWGTAKPFSVGWYCVSEGAELAAKDGHAAKWLPEGSIIRYREWYGWNGRPDKGCRLDSPSVARKIIEMEKENDELMDFRVGDSQMWAQFDGPSTQENMRHATDGYFQLRKSKKDRNRNYSEIISRLAGNPDFRVDGIEDFPMFYCAENCTHFWRTVPILVLDETDPEKGPGGKQEDHVYDEVAYAMRCRPYVSTENTRWEIEHGEEARRALGRSVDPYATA